MQNDLEAIRADLDSARMMQPSLYYETAATCLALCNEVEQLRARGAELEALKAAANELCDALAAELPLERPYPPNRLDRALRKMKMLLIAPTPTEAQQDAPQAQTAISTFAPVTQGRIMPIDVDDVDLEIFDLDAPESSAQSTLDSP